jgi:hypothetical protein
MREVRSIKMGGAQPTYYTYTLGLGNTDLDLASVQFPNYPWRNPLITLTH